MSFFDPPPSTPPPPAAPHYRIPEWRGPRENVVPGIAGLELVLANTGRVAVWIADAEAYPNGAVFKVGLRGREPAQPGAESGTGTWRFGLQFSDGRKTTAYGLGGFSGFGAAHASSSATAMARNPRDPDPEGPLLLGRGGGGSRNSWRQEYWLWPLPSPGDLTIACEWPNIGLELTTATVAAELILDAAQRSKELWPAENLPEWPGSRGGPSDAPPR